MYTSYQEQMEYLDFVHRHDYDGKPREILIREMAAGVIKEPAAYTVSGFHVVVRTMNRRNKAFPHILDENDALPKPSNTFAASYKTIRVSLVPELQGSPYVAQILAEQQLRIEWP